VLLDLDHLEKSIEHFKSVIEDKKEKHLIWKQNFTKEVNAKLNRVSQIKRVDIIDKPFEKTASQKIKRFLYTKKPDKKTDKK